MMKLIQCCCFIRW